MTNETNCPMTSMFRQAAETFGNAMQTGARFQQEMMSAFSRPMTDDRFCNDLRDRGQKTIDGAFKFMQKNIDEAQKLMDTQCRQSLDMLRKTFDMAKTPETRVDMFETTRNLWQNTFDTMKSTVDQMAKCNQQTVENFTSFVNNAMATNNCDRKPETRVDNNKADTRHDRKAMAGAN